MNTADRLDLTDQLGNQLLHAISSDIGKMGDAKFVDATVHNIKEMTLIQIGHLYNCDVESAVDAALSEAMELVTDVFIPKRSYRNTFADGHPDVEGMTKLINGLRARPQPDQRTEAWYRFRYNLITASNAWKAFGTAASVNQLIYEKCQPLNVEKYSSVNTESPMHWGQKYEDVSILYYEKTYNTKVEDFGCMADPEFPFIGASPDGINVKKESPRYGRMLEIKNPTSRPITGIPKSDYWIQMQMQMGVCGLEECDFLETSFKEYETVEEFEADGTFTETAEGKLKGIVMYFANGGGKPVYEYPPIGCTEKEFRAWESATMLAHSEDTWVKNCFWRLETVSCVLVPFNKLWFDHAVPILKTVWETVEKERVTGFEHRAAKKRKKVPAPEEMGGGCLLNIEKLQSDSQELEA
jgi:putative phage-type endonuclease